MQITYPGKPIPLQRARVHKNGFYDPQYQVKENIRNYIKPQIPTGFKPICVPIELDVKFYFEIPKSWSKKKKLAKMDTPHDGHVDIDNLLKFFFDAFNKFLYIDDALIWHITATKTWSDKNLTVITFID